MIIFCVMVIDHGLHFIFKCFLNVFFKKKEEERLAKIKELEKTNTNSALEQFEELQRQKEDSVNKKLDTAAGNKEKKMKEMKDKIRERERRAEMVRQRKQLALIEKQGQEEEENAIPRGKELDF